MPPSTRRWRDGGTADIHEPELTSDDVKSRAASGVVLLLGRGVAFRVLGLLGNLVLARLLVPADFGLVAIALSVVTLGQFLADASLGAQLITREAPPTRRELRAVTGMQLAITSAVGAIAALVGILVGGAALATVVIMLALPITAIRAPATLLFTRRMEFSRTVRIEIVEVLSYLVVAVGAASLGAGVWSLALATVIRSVAGAVVAVRLSPAGLLLPTWDPETIRPLLAFGARFQLASIIDIGHEVALTAGIAAIGGLTLVGLWSFAGRMIQVPLLVFEALFSVGFPAFSRLYGAGDDDHAMRQLVERLASLVCIGIAALMCPIVATAPAAVPLLFGDDWTRVSEILPGAGVALVIGAPVTTVLTGLLYSRGDARTVLWASAVDAVARLAVTFSLLPFIGPAAIGIGWAASVLVQLTITLRAVRRLIGARLLRCVVPPCVLASVAASGGWLVAQDLGRTVSGVAASAAISSLGYVILLGLFAPRQVRDAVSTLRSALRAVRRGQGALA
jgi:O-antigen/teichoic acid export membrane protein